MRKELLNIENLFVCYGKTPILRRFYLQLFKGDSHGLIFESALERNVVLEFLQGNIKVASGKIYYENKGMMLDEYQKCFQQNISLIHRTSKFIRSLNVEENVFLHTSRENRFFLGKRTYDNLKQEIIEALEVNLDDYKRVKELPSKDRIILEMVKAYVEDKKLIVFSSLSDLLKPGEFQEVYLMMERLRKIGMAFIVVETFSDLIFKWTEQLSVIKKGATAAVYQSETASRNEVYAALMAGEEYKKPKIMDELEVEMEEFREVLSMKEVSTDHLKDFNLSIGKGEVLKVYYTDDESCFEIVDLFTGEIKCQKGTITLNQKNYRVRNTDQAAKRGICFIEELPDSHMSIDNLNVFENISLLLGEKIPFFWFRKKYQKNVKEFLEESFGEDLFQKPEYLTPVKRQQMIYYKWLLYHPSVVVCIKPFTQEDVHILDTTIEMIEVLRKRGISFIILTSSLNDLHLVDGETIFLHKGITVDEDTIYQIMYGEND